MKIPPEHQRFLDGALGKLQVDERILGVAAGGSMVSHELDEFSDLDLLVVSEDDDQHALVTEMPRIAESLGGILTCFTGEHVGVPNMLIVLYENPLLHVDLKFVGISEFGKRIEDPVVLFEQDGRLSARIAETIAEHPMPDLQWIEDRLWGWVHYISLKVGRGELLETLGALTFIRERVLGPLSLVAHGELPRGLRRLESLTPRHIEELNQTVGACDWKEAVGATKATIALYRKLRDELRTEDLRLSRAEKPVMDYLNKQIALRNSTT